MQHFGAVRGELTNGFRKEPVVADGASDPPDRRVRDRKQRFVVAVDVVRAGVDFVRDPRVDLPVFVEDALGPDQARRVEDDARPARDRLRSSSRSECRSGARCALARQPIRVLVRESDRQLARGARRTVAKIGAACANSGKTTSRTGRNGALPATAESIIDSIRSVLLRIAARSIGLTRSVWQAAAAYRRRSIVSAQRCAIRAAAGSSCASSAGSVLDTTRVLYRSRYSRCAGVEGYASGDGVRIARHAVKRQRQQSVRTRRVEIHLLAEAVGVEEERACPAAGSGGKRRCVERQRDLVARPRHDEHVVGGSQQRLRRRLRACIGQAAASTARAQRRVRSRSEYGSPPSEDVMFGDKPRQRRLADRSFEACRPRMRRAVRHINQHPVPIDPHRRRDPYLAGGRGNASVQIDDDCLRPADRHADVFDRGAPDAGGILVFELRRAQRQPGLMCGHVVARERIVGPSRQQEQPAARRRRGSGGSD